MAAYDNVDKPLDYPILTQEGAAEVIATDSARESDLQLVDEEGLPLDADGGMTVNLGGTPAAADPNAAPPAFDSNLADILTEDELVEAANYVVQAYEVDKASRSDWEEAYAKGLGLLGIKREVRTRPFKNASGVVHPLLMEAVGQFQAGAYKELIPANGPASTQIIGKSTPELEKQAQRVKEYMNYKIMYDMEEFESDFDQMLYYNGLSGSTFKKVYFSEELGREVSEFLTADNVFVPYEAVTLRRSERITQYIRMPKNSVRKLQLTGFYAAGVDLPSAAYEAAPVVKEQVDDIQGITSTILLEDDGDLTLLECHCNFNFPTLADDSADGIRVPYVITVCKENNKVLGVRRNWREQDPLKRRKDYFVHYKFSPGLGFYGFGLIHLLGNLSEAATANLRQLIDAGTFSNLPAGFKTRGMRVQNAQTEIEPGEWRDVDVPGSTLRDSMMPLPYKEPSPTLFQLLGFLVQAAEKFIGTQELGIADGNKETPVGTTVALLERGTKIMSAVHKRLHGSLKTELKLLAALFAESAQAYPYEVDGATPEIFVEDFSPKIDVIPVSDPNIFSMAQRIVLAQEQLQLAMSAPEIHNKYEAFRRMYSAIGVQNIDAILMPPPQPMPENPAMENGRLPAMVAGGGQPLKAWPDQDHDAHIAAHMAFAQSPIVKTMPQIYMMLLPHIYEHFSLMAEAAVRKQMGLPTATEQMQQQQAGQQVQDPTQDPKFQAAVATEVAKYLVAFTKQEKELVGEIGEDPVIRAKNRELTIKQDDNESDRRTEAAKARMQERMNAENIASAEEMNREKIDSQERIAQMRHRTEVFKIQNAPKPAPKPAPKSGGK